jgi:hypothetical protein
VTTYREDVLSEIEIFEYEYCENCGYDVQRHSFVPGPFGHPHVFCLKGEEPFEGEELPDSERDWGGTYRGALHALVKAFPATCPDCDNPLESHYIGPRDEYDAVPVIACT